MDKDKAIRAAKLTLGGMLEKKRHTTAVSRADGQVSPSKYLPNVPRQVHTDGGKVAFMQGNHPDVPDVVYHGTNRDFRSFDPEAQRNYDIDPKRPDSTDTGWFGKGHYFAPRPKQASYYAEEAARRSQGKGAQVYPVHLSMKNPFVVNMRDSDSGATTLDKALNSVGVPMHPRGYRMPSEQTAALIGMGHDGVIAKREGKTEEIVAFHPNQIKSAIGNQGTFDPNDPDITKAAGGAANAPMFQDIHELLKSESGAPLDLYHGTTQPEEFEAFDDAKLGRRDAGFYGRGHYLTPEKDTADEYGEDGTVIGPLHAALKNPYVWDVSSDMKAHSTLRDLQSMGIMKEKSKLDFWDNLQSHHVQPFMAEMRKRGHDGVVVKTGAAHLPNGISEVVAFDPKTIKHTEAEAFDPTDPRIRREDGGEVDGNDNFRNWFGNSVTHTDGKPHVFYTGTSKDKDFTSHNVGRHGAWFVRDPAVASEYAEQNDSQGYKRDGWEITKTNTASRVIPAYVKAENPYTGDLPQEVLRDNYKAAQSEWFDTLRAKGHDSWIPASQNGNLVVALKEPQQIKSIFNSGKFDPNQKHMNKAVGGATMGYVPMASLPVGRLALAKAPIQQPQGGVGQFSGSLSSLMDTVKGFKEKPEDVKSQTSPPLQGEAAVPSAATEGHPPQETGGMSEEALAAYGKLQDAYGQPLNVISTYRDPQKNQDVGGAKGSQHLHGNAYDIDVSNMSYEDRLALADLAWNSGFRGIGFYDNSLHFDVGDPRSWGPSYSRDSIPDWAQPFTEERYGYAKGGSAMDKSGLYSKALEVARNIQQKRGTPEQFMAQLKNSKGVKPAEIEAIGMPTGDKITRDDFVKHIASKVPKLSTAQYGENPNYLRSEEQQFMRDTWMKEGLSREDEEKAKTLQMRRDARPFHERTVLGDDIEPGYEEYQTPGGENYRERLIKLGGDNQYQSSHWTDVPNVIAHIRMKDRNSPDGKKLLHVEEIQSDWGQQGREMGFYDPKNPYEVVRKGTKEVVSRHPDYSSMWDAYRTHPDSDNLSYGDVRDEKIPAAPYVQNTQHWTDLAMKHIMREAALGDYDGVIFTPGQVHANRYGMEDASGMKGYYDNIVPKSALSTVQQHDPSIKPQTMKVNGEYDVTHIPLTDTAKESILKNGFPMFNQGGTVGGKAEGGSAMDNDNQNKGMQNGNAPINFETRPQAGGLLNAGGVRGSAGVLQAQDEAPLEGLPTKIGIPLSGQSVTAGPDPRIRQVARDYMASTGMKYNPPTKYAKVDPIRARRIAAAYEGMKDDPNDPLTKASYDAMIKETMAQYNHAKKAGLKVEFWNPEKQEDPYGASPRLATEDVRKNHHMWVFPTYAGYGSGDPISEDDAKKNPLLQLTGETWNGIPVTVNDVFRAVHDYYGHAKEGVGFRADGEENAWRSHASMYSPLARMAMTSETRGQNSWLNYGPHGEKNRNARTEDTIFAPQKIGVMPHWAHHEGAEDFTLPEDVEAMQRIRSNFDPTVSKALALTRRFTKGGESAINALKSKGK